MSPRSYSEHALHHPEPLSSSDTVEDAVRKVLDSGLPALPVVGGDGGFAGIFGEREFMTALFPGYLQELRGAAYLTRSVDEAIERRDSCRAEPIERYMHTEHVELDRDYSDAAVAEVFMHHRVLVVPIVHDGRVQGIITRRDFFGAIAKSFIDA